MRRIAAFGAGSAIAAEVLKLYAAEGASFFLAGRTGAKLEALSGQLRELGAKKVEFCAVDLADIANHESLVAEILQSLGDFDTALLAWGELPDQDLCNRDPRATVSAITNNFSSIAALLISVAAHFERRGSGRIAVISSVAGDRGRQSNYVYGAAKAGLSALLSGLRNRLHRAGVGVTTIKPGFIDTPMTAGVKKGLLFAKPENVAKSIYRGIENGRSVVYCPWFWFLIMALIRMIPEPIFKRLKL